MKNLIATSLALLLVFTNIACVCAAPIDDVGSDPHAHHGQSQMGEDETPNCPHQDCDGDCSEELARAVDRDNTLSSSQKLADLDDPDFSEVPLQWPEVQSSLLEARPPPYILQLATVTPVQRKDLLRE